MADNPIPPPVRASPKAFGVPCNNISGHMKMTLFHPSQPNLRLTDDHLMHLIENYGFVEDIASGTLGTMHFKYNHPGPQDHDYIFPNAESNGLCPTPKLPRLWLDGLHPYTYRAFLDALNYYLQREHPQELFKLRFVPVNQIDENSGRRWCIAEVSGMTFVYEQHSLDIEDYNRYHEGSR